ncbi:MAG: prepilin-type N-terminal cleavage/methylation domain-containing protein [Sedimentisphaerales bacterium]|nr:prepilin-type N-terminal cleavage/methylation domain-containing protein [Sedimentisphaerales bacterium]
MSDQERGMTLLELLVALAISALLMTALAAAFNASVVSFTQNHQIQQTVTRARQALTRITTELRTAAYVDPDQDPNLCSLERPDGQGITFEYRAQQKALYLVTGQGNEYLLCDNIPSMAFLKTPTADGANCRLVTIAITVQAGSSTQTFSAATALRRNL